jgi:hypothetical protein
MVGAAQSAPQADAEHRRAQRPVKPLPRAVVVRLHPSALIVQNRHARSIWVRPRCDDCVPLRPPAMWLARWPVGAERPSATAVPARDGSDPGVTRLCQFVHSPCGCDRRLERRRAMRKHTQTIWARLDDVRVSDRRARAVNAAKVARYRDWLEQGRVAPPVRLVRNGDFFVVRDGRHRVAAALAAGHAVIEAELHRWIAALLGRTARQVIAACPSPSWAWGRCSGGRAPRLQRGSSGFDSHRLHSNARRARPSGAGGGLHPAHSAAALRATATPRDSSPQGFVASRSRSVECSR